MKLSKEIKHCLDSGGCEKCKYSEEKCVLTCRGLLRAAYEEIKRNEEVEENSHKTLEEMLLRIEGAKKGRNMKDRFDIDQVIKILGLNISADQADDGADFDVACNIARKKLWKAKEYEGLEEQGKLLKLPAAVGDLVYKIKTVDKQIIPLTVLNFIVFGNDFKAECADKWDGIYVLRKDDIGHDVFLTKSEAEEALQKMNETEGGKC